MSVGDDEHLIHDIITEEQAAWNAGDANAYAARFHAEGSFTNVFGHRYFGRELFRARHAVVFNTFAKGSKASLTAEDSFSHARNGCRRHRLRFGGSWGMYKARVDELRQRIKSRYNSQRSPE